MKLLFKNRLIVTEVVLPVHRTRPQCYMPANECTLGITFWFLALRVPPK